MRIGRFTVVIIMMLMASLSLCADGSAVESSLFTVNTAESIIDSDSDGLPDAWETENNLAINSNGASQDPDGDGFTNLQEYNNGTNPKVSDLAEQAEADSGLFTVDTLSTGTPDADEDGLPDAWESENNLAVNSNDASQDPDGDGFTNLQEYNNGTNPKVSDLAEQAEADSDLFTVDTLSTGAPDADEDGLPDSWESENNLAVNSNDASQDPDGDGFTNFQEYNNGTNPKVSDLAEQSDADSGLFTVDTLSTGAPDADGDGLPDAWESENNLAVNSNDASQDPDGDGFTNLQEYNNGTNPKVSDLAEQSEAESGLFTVDTLSTGTPDTDGDGLNDAWELAYGFNVSVNNASEDPDGDGLNNLQEYNNGTDPTISDLVTLSSDESDLFTVNTGGLPGDRDSDGMRDSWEIDNGTNPDVADGGEDPDGDGLTNFNEFLAGTNPLSSDTDGDGFTDGEEKSAGANPLNPNDASLNFLTWTISDGEVTITDCVPGASGALVIPDTIEGKPVTSIGDRAFNECTALTSITIPDGVTSIGDFAFKYCTALTSITIPGSVTSIGDFAFQFCSSLTSITFGENSKLTSIGGWAFESCGLTSITIPDNVTSIGNDAFHGCISLTSIEIPNSVTSIGDDAFAVCSSLTSITIPDSVTSIGNCVFALCSSLTNITIPDSVTSIGDRAFTGCNSLTSITIPDSVTNIGQEAFFGCTSLETVSIGNGVTVIGNSAFEDCINVRSISLGSSIQTIGVAVFNELKSLTEVTIPESVTSIGDKAFSGSTFLVNVTFLGDAPSFGSGVFSGTGNGSPTNIYARFYSDFPAVIEGYPVTRFILPQSFTLKEGSEIGTLTELIQIGNHDGENVNYSIVSAYGGGLKMSGNQLMVTNPNQLDYEGINPMEFTIGVSNGNINANALVTINLTNDRNEDDDGDGIVESQEEDVYGTSDLAIDTDGDGVSDSEEIALGTDPLDGVGVIENLIYKITSEGVIVTGYKRNAVGKIIVPAIIEALPVIEIGPYAFNHQYKLTEIVIPKGVRKIGQGAFDRATELVNVSIPYSVTSIGSVAFQGCLKLKSLVVPGSVKSLGNYAFNYCEKLTTVTLSEGLETIGSVAFGDCVELNSITIPSTVTSIGEGVFNTCSKLNEIIFRGNNPAEKQEEEVQILRFNRTIFNVYVPAGTTGWSENFGGQALVNIVEGPILSPQTFEIIEGMPEGTVIGTINYHEVDGEEVTFIQDANGGGYDPDRDGNLPVRIEGDKLILNDPDDFDYERWDDIKWVDVSDALGGIRALDGFHEVGTAPAMTIRINLIDDRIEDVDGDGLSEAEEEDIYNTNPLLSDTDGDGYSDGIEIEGGTSPTDPSTPVSTPQAPVFPVNWEMGHTEVMMWADENLNEGDLVGIINIQDANLDPLTITISKNIDPDFDGRPAFRLSGKSLLVNDPDDFDYETLPVLRVTLKASDGTLETEEKFTITLNDLHDESNDGWRTAGLVKRNEPVDLGQISRTEFINQNKPDQFYFTRNQSSAGSFFLQGRSGNNRGTEYYYKEIVFTVDVDQFPDQGNHYIELSTSSILNGGGDLDLYWSEWNTRFISTDPVIEGTLSLPPSLLTGEGMKFLSSHQYSVHQSLRNSIGGFIDDEYIDLTSVINDAKQDSQRYILFYLKPSTGGMGIRNPKIITTNSSIEELGPTIDLFRVNYRDRNLENEKFVGINMNGAQLNNANLKDADLSGSTLAGADLSGARLDGAKFISADLSFVDLSGANLEEVDFSDAILDGVVSGSITGTPAALPRGWTLADGNLTNKAPPQIKDQQFIIDESLSDGSLVGKVIASDEENLPITFSLVSETDRNKNSKQAFSFDGDNFMVNDSADIDYEEGEKMVIDILAHNGFTGRIATLTITLTDDRNEDFDGDGLTEAQEEDVHGTSDQDPDFDDDGLSDGKEIEIGTGVKVTDSDGDGYKDGVEFDENTDPLDALFFPNEVPIIDDQIFEIMEGLTEGSLIGILEATDRNKDDLTFSSVSGNLAAFRIEGNQLFIKDSSAFDYEVVNSVMVNVSVSDGRLSSEASITINLTDDREEDYDGDGLTESEEEDLHGTSDLLADSDGDNLNDNKEIELGTNPVHTDTDDDGYSDGAEIIAGTNPNEASAFPNEAPIIDDTIFSIDEGIEEGTLIGTLAATDRNEDPLVYALIDKLDPDQDGVNALRFDGSKLLVIDKDDFDYELNESISFTVSVTDNSLSDTAEVLILIQDDREEDVDEDGLTEAQEEDIYNTDPLNPDTDGDGLSDGVEIVSSTNPRLNDTDFDGLLDGQEIALETNPLSGDTDSDGVSDFVEVEKGMNPNKTDTDGDGLSDLVETGTGTYFSVNDTGTNPLKVDSDDDGLNDGVETADGKLVSKVMTGTSPNNPDTDGDGLIDGDEVDRGINPNLMDTDDDGLNDYVETNTGIYRSDLDTGTDPVNPDTDNDGLKDSVENVTGIYLSTELTGTNPFLNDTDEDGFLDGQEVDYVSNPLNKSETPDIAAFSQLNTTVNESSFIETPSGEWGASHLLGKSVAIDGDMMVVGMPGADQGRGAVHIYKVLSNTWNYVAKIEASNRSSQDQFGYSVAIKNNTIVVGAPGEDSDRQSLVNNNARDSGAVYVFKRSLNQWRLTSFLKAKYPGVDDHFGRSVDLSSNSIVVGAPNEDGNGVSELNNSASNSGAAYVFYLDRSGNWSQVSYLKELIISSGSHFGNSVSISGNQIIVGAPFSNDQSGLAHMFSRKSNNNWMHQQSLTGSNSEIGDQFGVDVDIHNDLLVVGSMYKDGGITESSSKNSGAAYVYKNGSDGWSEVDYLKASNAGVDDHFGQSVAIHKNTIVVGAPNESGDSKTPFSNGVKASGAVYVYHSQDESSWTQIDYIKSNSPNAQDQFGIVVDANNDNIIVGNPGYDAMGSAAQGNVILNEAGAVHLYDRLSMIVPSSLETIEHYAEGSFIGEIILINPEKGQLNYDIYQNFDLDKDGKEAFRLENSWVIVNDSDDLDYELNPIIPLVVRARSNDLNRTILANYSVSLLEDSDDDGLPNQFETGTGVFNSVYDSGTDPEKADTDGDGYTDGEEAFTGFNPNDPRNFKNEPPIITSNEFTVNGEFPYRVGHVIGEIIALDRNSDSVSLVISRNSDPDGDGQKAFRIIGKELQVNDSDDFNYKLSRSLEITVNASDGILKSDALIRVLVPNQSPVIENANLLTIEMNREAQVLGDISVSDPENDSLSLSILQNSDNDLDGNQPFRLEGRSVVVNDSEDLDYSKSSSIEIIVRLSDGENIVEKRLEIKVLEDSDKDKVPDIYETATGVFVSITNTGTDPNLKDSDQDGYADGIEIEQGLDPNDSSDFPNEPPEFLTDLLKVPEKMLSGFRIGEIKANDPNNDNLTISIIENVDIDGDGINAVRKEDDVFLVVNDSGDFDFEKESPIYVKLGVSDGRFTVTKRIRIDLLGNLAIKLLTQGDESDGSPTLFELTRSGDISTELDVNLLLIGTASPGKDYQLPEVASGKNRFNFRFGPGRTTLIELPTLSDGNIIDPGESIIAIIQPGDNYGITPSQSRAKAIITADGVKSSANDLGEALSPSFQRGNSRAFVALRGNGTVVSWGNPEYGGDLSGVKDDLASRKIVQIFSAGRAFAALSEKGGVVTWGNQEWGGNSQLVKELISSGVKSIASNYYCFAAIKDNGSVVTWGPSSFGGDVSNLADELSSGVLSITRTDMAFAALKDDGSVVTWGRSEYGGNSDSVANRIRSGVVKVYGNKRAFAALKDDGSVVTWGEANSGGVSSSVEDQILSGVVKIYNTDSAFAALKEDGTVVTWGEPNFGGRSSSVRSKLNARIIDICGSEYAFAALKEDGSVVTWGWAAFGGDSSSIENKLSSGVVQLFRNRQSFAALKDDGSVVVWGSLSAGGSLGPVSTKLNSGVVDIIPGLNDAYAALKNDGSVVTWGSSLQGGDSSSVSDQISSAVVRVVSNTAAFVALKEDGSIVTWGGVLDGGDSTNFKDQLDYGVISVSNTFSSEKFLPDYKQYDSDLDRIPDQFETGTGVYISQENTGTNPKSPDSDQDGLSDLVETNSGLFVSVFNTGTDPNDNDTDDDGLVDGLETNTGIFVNEFDFGTDPHKPDTDNDGLIDSVETATGEYVSSNNVGSNPHKIDTDEDGLSDFVEIDKGTNPNNSDTDNDGLNDSNELANGTNPIDADTDNDQLLDSWETGTGEYVSIINTGTDPLKVDTDGDGLSDYNEVEGVTNPNDSDTDNDGLNDFEEIERETDPNSPDSDKDGLSDLVEIERGTDPKNPDSDNDGLSDSIEVAEGTDPNDADTDNDQLLDSWETGTGQYVSVVNTGTDPLKMDTDGDGLSDSVENNTGLLVSLMMTGSDPNDSDTDGDGLNDGMEINMGINPNNNDSDNDGLNDLVEVNRGTDPSDVDTDGDTLSDFVETNTGKYLSKNDTGTDPTAKDTDMDGLSDSFEIDTMRYYLIRGSYNWDEADEDARRRGGVLAEFLSRSDWERAMEAIGSNALNNLTGVWIGGSDAKNEGQWRWGSGELLSFNRWGPGQPDNNASADYVEVSGGFGALLGYWFDTPKQAKRDGYLLQVTSDPTKFDTDNDGLGDGYEIGVGRFSVVKKSINWDNAKEEASSNGGQLATFETELEWQVAQNTLGSNYLEDVTGLWIGGTDGEKEGVWKWITGSLIEFNQWFEGQPDNLADANAAEISGSFGPSKGAWFDTPSAATREGYIFELGQLTDPNVPDSDNDGYSDGDENSAGSSPIDSSDVPRPSPVLSDKIIERLEGDSESLVLSRLTASHPDGDNVTLSLVENPDLDGDGNLAFSIKGNRISINDIGDFDYELAEAVEVKIRASSIGAVPVLGVFKVNLIDDRNEDFDNDGLSEQEEEDLYGTSDLLLDSDGDGLSDSYELGLGRFSIIFENVDLGSAAESAEGRGGYLATFATETEWNMAMKSIGEQPFDGYSGIWIGAVKLDDSNWGWISGEEMDYKRWAEGDNRANDAVKLTGTNANTVEPGYWVSRPSNGTANGYVLEVGYPTNPVSLDTDGDGVGDKEEIESGTNPLVFDEFFEGDGDKDGWQDETELLFGSSPINKLSTPNFEIILNVLGQELIEIKFPARKDTKYTIQSSSDMKGWVSLEKFIIGDGGTYQQRFQIISDQKFFRIIED